MTDLSVLYTQRTAQTPQSGSSAPAAPLSSDNPLFKGAGSFLDLIFTLQESAGKTVDAEKTLTTEKIALSNLPAPLDDLPLETSLEISDVPTNKKDAQIPDVFAGLLAATPKLDNQGNPSILTNRAAELGDQIDLQNRLIENGIPTLIATDLTPAQLKLLNTLSDEEIQKLSSFDLVALGITLPTVIQQPTNIPATNIPDGVLTKTIPDGTIIKALGTKDAKGSSSTLPPATLPPEIAAQLNAMDVGGDQTTDEDFENVLRQLSAESGETGDIDITTLKTITKDVPTNFVDYLKSVNAGRVQAGAELLGNAVPSSLLPFDQGGIAGGPDGSFTITSMPQNNHAAQIQSMTKANIAGGVHPVTAVIAATITKAANGAPKDITVQLHPAELGRVNVKIGLNKDKSVNAVLTIEKPETYLMLQKDQAALQQTLQNLGIQAGGELSFQLAHDGAFDRKQNQSGSGDGNTKNSNTNEDLIEIDTGMRWFVDPSTGRTRYNLLA